MDVWSFGCIYFELVEKEAFVPLFSLPDCRHCIEWRLFPMPADAALWVPGPRAFAGLAGLRQLGEHSAVVHHPWITGSLRWLEEHRRGARTLLMLTGDSPAMESDRVSIDGRSMAPDPRAIAGSPAAPTQRMGSPAAPTQRMGPTMAPSPSMLSTRGDMAPRQEDPRPCKCAGHCYQPGHRTRGGCLTQSVVRGTQYCVDCLCCVPSCGRPRLRGHMCSAHRNFAEGLSTTTRLVQRVGPVLPELMPSMCMLPGIVERSTKTNDLGCLIVAALLQNPIVVDYFIDVWFAEDDVTDWALFASMRFRCKQAIAAADETETSLGRSGATASGSQQHARHPCLVSLI